MRLPITIFYVVYASALIGLIFTIAYPIISHSNARKLPTNIPSAQNQIKTASPSTPAPSHFTTPTNVTQPSIALVSMTNMRYQFCALEVFRTAREHGWKHPMYLLTIDDVSFDVQVLVELAQLGVRLIETNPTYNEWLSKKIPNKNRYRELHEAKMRKLEILVNPILRQYDRLLFLDADGAVQAPLEPFATMEFPEGKAILMRENGLSLGKGSLYENELAPRMLTREQRESLYKRFPDRETVGATCWFVVDVTRLPSAEELIMRSVEILCMFRAAFQLNDQTLINLLLYDQVGIFPHCITNEVAVFENVNDVQPYCQMLRKRRLKILSRKESSEDTEPTEAMYKHLFGDLKNGCLAMAGRRSVASERAVAVLREDQSGLFNSGSFALYKGKSNTCMEAYAEWEQSNRLQ